MTGHANGRRAPHTRVLLVDDEVQLRRLLRVVLERSGRFEVVGEAGDGREALELAADLSPDLVVLDLSMPHMDGLEALPRLKRLLPTPRVVVLSGFTAAQSQAAAEQAGADAYVEKGLDPRQLLDALDRALRGESRAHDEAAGDDVVRPSPIPTSTAETVARLAHDVRTALLTAGGTFEVLRDALPADLPEDLSGLIEATSESLDRVERLLRAAVEHARSGHAPLDPRTIPLCAIAGDAVAAVNRAAERVSVDADPDVTAFADADAARRVIMILVDNALHYSEAEVVVSCSSDDGVARIEVRDHGPGLGRDPTRLFEPFVRGESSAGRPGSGLGLATAADLLRRMQGQVSAYDHPEGGAVFRVELPAV